MRRSINVPFGPQHPVLPEPIHVDLVIEDERVLEAIPSIGYIHRGLESLVTKRNYPEMVYIAERICGICSFIHGLCYVQGVESIMDVEVPPRASYLRTIWSEYSRLHSHLLWLGLFADAMGFENLFMNAWRLREFVLDEMEATTGGRVIQGACKVGGVRKDISDSYLGEMADRLDGFERGCREIADVFLKDGSVRRRLCGMGYVSRKDAWELGAVGPTVRASGVDLDARSTGYAAYGDLPFEPVVLDGGDSYARCAVRVHELFTSIDLIRAAIDAIPSGEVAVKVKGNPDGEVFSRAEQPRGEVIHYIRGDGKPKLRRFRVRTPTLANLPAMVRMLEGCELADVPINILSIDPCIACCER
ncbi:MAG: hydrogenase large subunit [Methanoculleaceae archaeon]